MSDLPRPTAARVEEIRWRLGVFPIPHALLCHQFATELLAELDAVRGEREREFIVLASGHGSAERPNYPPSLSLLTREEAEAEADRWVRTADTIGGTASVVRAVDYIAQLHQSLATEARKVTNEMVERAARVLGENASGRSGSWDGFQEPTRSFYRSLARRALIAALGAPVVDLTEARKDTARLDWLDARVKDEGPWRDLLFQHDGEDGVWISEVERGETLGAMALDRSATPLLDIRAAIDAAAHTPPMEGK